MRHTAYALVLALQPLANAQAADYFDVAVGLGPSWEEGEIGMNITAGVILQAGGVRAEINPFDATYLSWDYVPEDHGYQWVEVTPSSTVCQVIATSAVTNWQNCAGERTHEWVYMASGSLTYQFAARGLDLALGVGARADVYDDVLFEENIYGVASFVAGPESEIILRATDDYASLSLLLRY